MVVATPRLWVQFPGKAIDKNVNVYIEMQCKSLWIKRLPNALM